MPDGVRNATRRLKRLHADREALEAKLARSEKEQADLAECQSLSELALHQWDSMKFSTKLRFVRLLVAQANMTAASPHFLRLDIVIGTPFYRILTGFLYRARGSRAPWTPEETDALQRLYPIADRADVLKAIPMRSWEAIIQQANIAGLPRRARLNTSDIPENLSYADVLLMQQEKINQDGTPRNDKGYHVAGVWRSQEIPIEDNQASTLHQQGRVDSGQVRPRRDTDALLLFCEANQRHIGVFVGQTNQVDEPCFGKRRHDLNIAGLERIVDQPGISG